MKKELQSLEYSELELLLANEPKYRVGQLFEGLARHKTFDEISNLPASIRTALEADHTPQSLTIEQVFVGADGTEKYLFRLGDGETVEGVLLKQIYGNTVCVSTQVGCRMGCAFCASGLEGLVRNLSAGEILAQVLAVNRRLAGGLKDGRAVTNVVLMGSGEPLDNFDNVAKFLRLVSDNRGIGISPRNITLSTCGLADKIRALADLAIPVNLSISLHSPYEQARAELMPISKSNNIKSLIPAAKYYFERTGRRIGFEYAMISGKNTDEPTARALASLLAGLPCHVNLIPLSPVKERALRSADKSEILAFFDILKKHGIAANIRHSKGNDIGGACGQLALRQRETLNMKRET
jgi:23S rRNA (adenine2503-C2)-methyltransferase